MEAIDRLHTTAESHHRVLVVEVMGRHAGWIALHAGLAGGANVILIPEQPFALERVCACVESRFQSHYAPIVVVAEGATAGRRRRSRRSTRASTPSATSASAASASGWPSEIEKRTGKEARTIVLGHIQRGGTPTAFDRVLATRFGLHAIDAVHDGDFGKMVALRGTDIVRVPLAEATAELKTVPPGALRRGRGLLRLSRPSRRSRPALRWMRLARGCSDAVSGAKPLVPASPSRVGAELSHPRLPDRPASTALRRYSTSGRTLARGPAAQWPDDGACCGDAAARRLSPACRRSSSPARSTSCASGWRPSPAARRSCCRAATAPRRSRRAPRPTSPARSGCCCRWPSC